MYIIYYNIIKKSTMEIKQSYIMTIARAKLSLYEQRLLIKCVQSGQP